MIGGLGLNDYFSGELAATGPSGDLHKLSEESLGRAKVGTEECAVGVQHYDERELGEVVTLCERLRSHQNVYPLRSDVVAHALPCELAPCAVAIDSQDARARKARLEKLLYPLGTFTNRSQILATAGRATFWQRIEMPAQVTGQLAIPEVYHEMGGAARAPGHQRQARQ